MKTLMLAVALTFALVSGTARAETACEAKAAEQKLAGAAKASFLKKCVKDAAAAAAEACAAKALDKDGKPLAGAAKTSFIKKCEKDAAAAK
jgi:hypothetical protein